MSDLVTFLRARLDEDEQVTYNPAFMPVTGPGLSDLVKRGLAEVEAKRALMEGHERHETGHGTVYCLCQAECGPIYEPLWPCKPLRWLALPYASHPDFDERWRP